MSDVMEVSTKTEGKTQYRIVGKNLLRKEGIPKVTGEAKYIDDIPVENCLYGRTIRSPEPRGKIKDIKFKQGIPWDEFVIVRPEDIPGENIVQLIHNEMPYLAEDEVKYRGEPVALIAHKDELLVDKAVDYVEVVLETNGMATMFTIDEALESDDVQYKGGLNTDEDNILCAFEIKDGDMEKGWQEADVIVEDTYQTAAQEHLYIEPNGVIAKAVPGKSLTVDGSMQCPYYVQKAMMALFELEPENVRIVQTETGGAFGGKEDFPSMLAGHAGLLSWKADGKPVKMIYSREEDMLATTKRHPSQTVLKAGFKNDGTLVALDIDFILDGGAYPTLTSTVLSRGILHSFGPYRCENVDLRARATMTNSTPYGAFRGFGAPQSIFAMELNLNKAAEELGIDPAELRRKNFLKKGDRMPTGQEIKEDIDLERLLDQALKNSDYWNKLQEHKKFNHENSSKKRGMGLSVFFHGSGFTGSGEETLASKLAVRLTAEDQLEILTSNVEFGQGIHTGFPQIAAETCNIPVDWVTVHQPDTSKVPDSGPTVASRSTYIVGNLIQLACEHLCERLQEKTDLPVDFDEKDFKIAAKRYLAEFGDLVSEVQYSEPPDVRWDDEKYRGEAYSGYAWSCNVFEVEVDLVDYRTRVLDIISVVECGQVINPNMAAGQIEGGIGQAVGYALYEYPIMDDGAMQNN
ncbi:MAG: xanthine dehydrogenase family protein molybdopterin-binding subunit, partial [bacterium]